jgi:NTP pyrophosphatase (non-canonical NTP hydrolase)
MLNDKVLAAVLEFRRKRDWEQFHQPKELAAAITVEASELLEIFQWKSHDEVARLLESPSRVVLKMKSPMS